MTLIKRHQAFPFFTAFFDDDYSRRFMNWPGTMVEKNSIPAVNIREDENEFTIEIAAPGMKKEDFSVEHVNNILTISSVKENVTEEKNEKSNYTRKEFSYSSFKRSFSLPEKLIDFSNAKGTYENGILSIIIPKKKEETENKKKLEIN
jgi:HSP20 family protein